MVHTEIQVKNSKKYYYRTLSYRKGERFHKLRKYLGKELTKKDLLEKEKSADTYLESRSGKLKKIKIGEKKLYKQSGAGITLTIGMAVNSILEPIEVDKDLNVFYKGDLVYSTPDLQFFHYFAAEELFPTAKEILNRMEKDKKWMFKKIKQFEKATEGFEDLGEELIEKAKTFSDKDKVEIIKLYEKFLKKDYEYWVPSQFIDLFDIFESEILEFIFKEKLKEISKGDLHFLLLPASSVYWEEKDDLNKIKNYIKEGKIGKIDELFWSKLKNHAKKYWWIKNDYQHVQKLSAINFIERLSEKSEEPFWKNLPLKKKEIIKKYSLDKEIILKLDQITEMAYLRDIRKKYTQIANYYLITFFHTIAKKIKVPLEWSNFVVPFKEYKKFLSRDKKFIKELESRTKTGVWMIGADNDWNPKIESKRTKELLDLVEKNLKKESVLYGNVASLGKARGIVKIILRQSDFDKFNEGDILITGMTRPEFVPLMKKASAIVTDEGGITCHAAIISRELSKPCVIATQNATKTFKDGDLVEVNANHGFIKTLK